MRRASPVSTVAAWCGSMLLPLAGYAAESSAPVQATWKTQEIRYSYVGFTTAYNCDAAESRLKAILRALGAHEQTRVSAQGCDFNRPSRNFFINMALDENFPAQWQTIELARDRKLDLQPGDCELMQGLREHVLPKLSVKVVADRVNCVPRQLSYQTPELTVSALVPMAKPDAPSKGTN
jgi:hypothetical protein